MYKFIKFKFHKMYVFLIKSAKYIRVKMLLFFCLVTNRKLFIDHEIVSKMLDKNSLKVKYIKYLMLCMCRELYEEGSHQRMRDTPLGVHLGENQGPPMRSACLLRKDFHALKTKTNMD